MPLTPQQLLAFNEALIDAYSDYQDLKRMLRVRVGENLEHFHGLHATLPEVVSDLIIALDQKGWTDRLIEGAYAERPENEKIKSCYERYKAAGSTEGADRERLTAGLAGEPSRQPPLAVSISRLPATGRELFGREQELRLLDEAWADDETNVVSLVAWGGVGKSALVNRWLRALERDQYRGAERVYAWSFDRQGTTDQVASADQFIDSALRWFGDDDPNQGSPWEKGERLARLVKARRTLLLLDGLEPLQYPPGQQEGQLKDQALQALLRELAASNPGLCVISTRLAVADLEDFEGGAARRIDLKHLSPRAGADLLRALGVLGQEAELEEAARAFDGHALSLTLLGSYLSDVYAGEVRRWREVGRLAEDERHGGHARRVMGSYERWFGEGPELAVLRLLGLFDRPADGQAVAVLRAAPAIAGLTDALQALSEPDWQRLLARLRRARLLAAPAPSQPDTLDAHPLVREHFGDRLRQQHPEAWREGNNRLYEHLKSTAKELPDTLEELAPLYAAVVHGCRAGRHQEALDEVYLRRIQRGGEFFSTNKLGAFGADLAALSGFFDQPWHRPVDGIRATDRAFVLNQAGFRLRALGRLTEAVQPMRASLDAQMANDGWMNGAAAAVNLSELYVTLGDLAQALACAEQAVDLADRGRDAFLRMVGRTTLADALHQAGRLPEAETAFREAEELQEARQPSFPRLYAAQGFGYCDLLLGQGRHREALERASQSLEIDRANTWLLGIGLDHLSLGRAHLHRAQQEGANDYAQAVTDLERAVDGLRRAGARHELPLGLLARAELRRVTNDLERARADLDEALAIATRGSMGLHQADCHLGYACLHLALGDKEAARKSLATARAMITRMGYRRRDQEVAELEALLCQPCAESHGGSSGAGETFR